MSLKFNQKPNGIYQHDRLPYFVEVKQVGNQIRILLYKDDVQNEILNPADVLEIPFFGFKIPVGTIILWSATNPPAGGFTPCDGTVLARADFPDLFAIIGTTFGEGDGLTTFNVPDLRGRFLRFWDNGAGRDPDSATRTASGTNGATGDNPGSVQDEEMLSHQHSAGFDSVALGNAGGLTSGILKFPPPVNGGISTGLTGGTETRPKNIYLNALIRIL